MIIQSTYLNISSQVVKTFAMTLNSFSGSFNGSTADRFLQIYDAKVLPANGAVPLRVYDLFQGSAFSWNFPTGLVLTTGLVFAVSTTEETLTISTDKIELMVDGISSAFDDSGTTVVGDYTTDQLAAPYQIWAEAAGPLLLKRIELTTLVAPTGETLYALLFCKDTVTEGDTDFLASLPVASGQFFFKLIPFLNTKSGLTIAISESNLVYAEPETGQVAIRATYK